MRSPAGVSASALDFVNLYNLRLKIVDDQAGREQTPRLKVEWHQQRNVSFDRRSLMGRGILLWLLGVPLPIIILLALFMR